MERKHLAMASGVVGMAVLAAVAVFLVRPEPAHSALGGEKGVAKVKVLLPQEDAKVTIDGQTYKGEGVERTYKVSTKKDKVTIQAVWEPNNYTHIYRKKVIELKAGAEITVDLRKPTDIKDDIKVRWVPTPDDVVDKMCEVAKVSKTDVVYDLGCGDAVMLIRALKPPFSAKRGVGVDIDQKMVAIAQKKAKEAGVADKIEIRKGDVLKVEDLSDADVVLLYMGDDINMRLKPILKKTLKPGARVVSHRFLMGDDWPPEKTWTVNSTAGYPCDVHLWTIRAAKKEKEDKE